ncbi:MAG: catalytic domain protein [Verrucomicrobia bacterium]|jgi:putative endonuclease|nr:catalytic domain protein [Verrucomicrobiota bacterium]
MKYQVYVIQNAEGRFYIGLSEDVAQRLSDHNRGVSKWTKSRGPWRLVWNSEAMTVGEAKKLESLLKKQKGGDGFYRMIGLRRSAGS